LIIEGGGVQNIIGDFQEAHVQKFEHGPLRYLENFYLLFSARIKGYKNFYVHYSYAGAINASLIARLTGARSFYWSCGMMWLFEKRLSFKTSVLKQKLVGEWPLKLILKICHFLVTGNETMKRAYVEHYKLNAERVKVMPNWIDLQRFDPGRYKKEGLRRKYDIDIGKKVVLFVHHLSGRKGADLIPDIVLGFKTRNDIIFIVCGRGPAEQKLKEQVKDRGLDKIVRFEGGTPNKLIPEYFAMADVFLMPSREEGFPRVLLESMAMSVPYVASAVGGVREITPDTLQEYINDNLEDVAFYERAIESLINKNVPGLRDGVSKYDTQKVVEIFLNIFK